MSRPSLLPHLSSVIQTFEFAYSQGLFCLTWLRWDQSLPCALGDPQMSLTGGGREALPEYHGSILLMVLGNWVLFLFLHTTQVVRAEEGQISVSTSEPHSLPLLNQQKTPINCVLKSFQRV